jgi:hypothetical protein
MTTEEPLNAKLTADRGGRIARPTGALADVGACDVHVLPGPWRMKGASIAPGADGRGRKAGPQRVTHNSIEGKSAGQVSDVGCRTIPF